MVTEPSSMKRTWGQRLIVAWVGEIARILALSLLCGFLIGTGLVLARFSEFSHMPDFVGYLTALIAGGFIGLLIRQMSHSLIAFLLTTVVSAVVSTLALSYPELQANRLGVELAVQLSALQGLTDSFFTVPFTLVGLLAGKWLSRSD